MRTCAGEAAGWTVTTILVRFWPRTIAGNAISEKIRLILAILSPRLRIHKMSPAACDDVLNGVERKWFDTAWWA
jgi:hypothetical protein